MNLSKLTPSLPGLRKSVKSMDLRAMRMQNPIKSVGMKLFLIFFVCIVALVVFVGLFSYNESKKIIENKVQDATKQTITQSANKIELIFNNYEDVTMQMLVDADIKSQLATMQDPKASDYDKLQSTDEITKSLSKYTNGKAAIANASIIPVKEGRPLTSGNAGIDNFRGEEWFKKVQQADGSAVWLETRKGGYLNGGSETLFAVSRVLKNQSTGAADYILLLEIPVKVLDNAVKGVKIGNDGEIVIVNQANQMVRATDPAKTGTPYGVPLTPEQKDQSLDGAESLKSGGDLVVFKKMNASGWTLAAQENAAELVQDAGKIFNVTMWMAVLAMAVAAVIGLIVARMIGRPLQNLRNLMMEGENGNLTVRTQFRNRDEIGQLGASFNQMMSQITRLVMQTNESAQRVQETSVELLGASKQTAGSAREIAVATEEIANGASSLAMEAEKGSGLTMEIGEQMRKVITSNMEMGASAAEVKQASEQGTRTMGELSRKTASTEEMTRMMVEKVDRLKESTTSIRKILDVLNNLTKQTNILSLNATIEAARAGAAGKGFMVVADEIRKLAEQSKQSIGVVGDITETIRKEIDGTVSVLSDAYPLFKEQIHSVKEAEVIFGQVESRMAGFVSQLNGVTESIQGLEDTQTNLSETMTNVSAVSEESSATSQEVASLSSEQLNVSEGLVKLSENLEQLSFTLQDALSKFRV